MSSQTKPTRPGADALPTPPPQHPGPTPPIDREPDWDSWEGDPAFIKAAKEVFYRRREMLKRLA